VHIFNYSVPICPSLFDWLATMVFLHAYILYCPYSINIIETALSGKNSLKKILTKIGIAILILGAILQLSVTK